MNLVDTHCHLNFEAYHSDLKDVLTRSRGTGVSRVIVPAIDLPTCQQVTQMSAHMPGIYAAVGIHPNSTKEFASGWIDSIRAFTQQPGVVAIGEIGLDYHWRDSPKSKQFEAFEMQLQLAAQLDLPVIIHNRDSSEDCLDMLESWVTTLPSALRHRPGVMHSFSGDAIIAERALNAGFHLGFTGPITYKNADQTRAIAAATPLDRLLVETDGPFLTPVPHRGKRNEPAYIPFIIDRLAALHGVTPDAMAEATTANATRLFNLPSSQ